MKLEEKISIIIPVKNEADTVSSCLSSIVKLDYPNKEIIVVCAKSDDGTEEIVRSFPVKVINETEPPSGWIGKNWACHLGYQASTGSLLLFTDGDVVHDEKSLSSSVEFMKRTKADMVSCWPKIVTRSFFEALVLPIGYFLLSAGIATVAKTKTKFGALVKGANGQFILIRRESYDAIGGHSSVKDEVLEDAALGRRAVDLGLKVINVRAEGLLRVYPYRNFAELKLAFQRFGGVIMRSFSILSGIILAHMLYFVFPFILGLLAILYPSTFDTFFRVLSILSLSIVSLCSAYFYKMNSRLSLFFLFPIAAILTCLFYISGYVKAGKDGVKWKGRAYKVR